jgi:hypothetical protein
MATNKNLTPLPIASGKGLQPLRGSDAPAASPSVEASDPVEQWMSDNPEGAPEATPSSEVVASERTPEVEDKPPVPPAAEHSEGDKPPQAQDKPATTPVPEVKVEKQVEAPAAPASVVPKTYASDERLALADGVEWTREQVVTALRERAELQRTAPQQRAEVEGFTKLFGVQSLQQAQQNWGPLLQRLSSEPETTNFLDGYLRDPAKAAYLQTCAEWFDQQPADPDAPAAQQYRSPQQSESERVMAQQLRELNEWKNAQEKRVTDERVAREWSTATQQYPFLATDTALRQDLLTTAQWMNSQDPNKGILDALAAKAAIYDAVAAQRGQQQPALRVVPQQQPKVPAMLGSPGASPSGTRTVNTKPKKFDDLGDAVEDWVSTESLKYERG